MILRPDLRALREDDGPQRAAQAAMRAATAAWRGQPEVAAVLEGIAALAGGAPIEDCSALGALFVDGDAGSRFVRRFVLHHAEAVARRPLGHVALRHFTDGLLSTLLLARAGAVTLTLVAIDGVALRRQPAPVSVSFRPADTWERVLSGKGSAELVERGEAGLARKDIALRPGLHLRRDAARQALLIRHVEGCLVSLRLQRAGRDGGTAREHALDDGRLLHQAASDPDDSRVELMMALLGRMGRADAAPIMAGIALGERAPALRWQALRECLALDTARGFAALRAAAERDDPLAAPAASLRARLVATWPALAELDACPA